MCRVILMKWDWMIEGMYRIHFWLGDGRDDGWDVEKFLAVVFG